MFEQESDLTVDRRRQIVEEELQSFSRGTPDEVRVCHSCVALQVR